MNKETGKPEEQDQLRLNIKIDTKTFIWDISKGVTTSSVYGQLMLLGKNWNGLKGQGFTLVVKKARDKNDYTILEAVSLMKPKTESIIDKFNKTMMGN
jgi:hypothetical protein